MLKSVTVLACNMLLYDITLLSDYTKNKFASLGSFDTKTSREIKLNNYEVVLKYICQSRIHATDKLLYNVKKKISLNVYLEITSYVDIFFTLIVHIL